GEVISADSRQVYKGLDIGTGKITKREMRGVPHHLLDVASPKHVFSVVKYQKLYERALRNILKEERLPIIAGGTGFYIDAAMQNMTLPAVPANLKLRKRLAKKGTAELFALLKKKDPRRAKEIDPHNPHRLIRALEIAKALGKIPSLKKSARKYDALFIGLALPPDTLKRKIRARLVKRMKQGMVAEARCLHHTGLSYKRMRELGLEYRYLADLLQGVIIKEEFVERLSTAIWQYARRQMTWFRRNKDIRWFSLADTKKIEREVRAFLADRGNAKKMLQ
ncbi:MAG TPA: tRNA (adenosine(37)-N6)-dimethylallyltransferase MiaA, partial [Candidatus Paceibacterota bacterium]|nr:tRNA (adenosine(37)-N6)-dimethylallyltransferase MiaA [Candidatus Paceibacterota bacterium]